ncbi:MAG: amidohydrolase family protein [Bdellovibrionales bacterium]|nr:amidohydrolase family protein [Bdellovibrionales bacterium]
MIKKIVSPFDSHVHWLGTGEKLSRFELSGLKNPNEISELKVKPEHYRGDWIVGGGWDDNLWSVQPTKEILDRVFPNNPVALRRVDGHALWVNSKAIELATVAGGLPFEVSGGRIVRDVRGDPTGVFVDLAMGLIYPLIPKSDQVIEELKAACAYFNQQGFTHIRDMSCNEHQWNQSVKLSESGELTLYVDQLFHCDKPQEFERPLKLALQAKNEKHKHLKVAGVKLYYDGALGSEGALLSKNYKSRDHAGFRLAEKSEMKKYISEIWKNNLPVAVHVIGDLAAQEISEVAIELYQENKRGELQLEHSELLNDLTIQNLEKLNVTCHFQPCHWLSDKRWLKDKIGDLTKWAFRWKELESKDISFFFGSDSPIEESALLQTYVAVADAAENGIPRPQKPIENYMSHPNPDERSYCELDEFKILKVVFDGKPVFQNET